MMLKKHMTPLQPHSKKGALHTSVNKGSNQRDLAGAGHGGGPSSFQSYTKATPMAQSDQPAPAPDGLGSGSFGGIPLG